MKLPRRAARLSLLALLLAGLCSFYAFDSARAGGNPLASLQRDARDSGPIRGRVEQRLRAGSYTYLALRTEDDALLWTVTLGSGAPEGARVSVRSMGHRTNFTSRRLQRTFSDLVFGIVSRID